MVAPASLKYGATDHRPSRHACDADTVIEKVHAHGVVELQLNRPEKLNCFSSPMYLRAASLLDKYSKDGESRIIVITAAGRNFCAGMDIGEASKSKNITSILNAAFTFMNALMNCRCIIVAAMFGSVTGIGVTMFLHCDIVFSHTSAKFQTAFPSVGMVPEFASSLLFPMFLGPVISSKLLLRGETVSADELEKQGCLQILHTDDICTAAIDYAITWSREQQDDQWKSVEEAKYLTRKPIREKASEAIEAEYKSIHKMNQSGILQRLITAKYNQISNNRRRAML